MQQITIGRDPRCTIVVDARYDTVSSNHATLIAGGGGIQLEDHSSNGTYVNGRRVHHSTITIRPEDTILLGTHYELNWQDVQKMLQFSQPTQRLPHFATRQATPMQNQVVQHIDINIANQLQNCNKNAETNTVNHQLPTCYNTWNWGAFFFGWLWGCLQQSILAFNNFNPLYRTNSRIDYLFCSWG